MVYHSDNVQYFHFQLRHLYLDISTPQKAAEVSHFSCQKLCGRREAEIRAAFSYDGNNFIKLGETDFIMIGREYLNDIISEIQMFMTECHEILSEN